MFLGLNGTLGSISGKIFEVLLKLQVVSIAGIIGDRHLGTSVVSGTCRDGLSNPREIDLLSVVLGPLEAVILIVVLADFFVVIIDME